MRIAFIAPFGLQPKGTVSARMLPLAHALARRGHRVRVVIPPWDDPTARPGSARFGASKSKVEVITLPLPQHAPKAVSLTAGLVKHALRQGTDIVHVFKPVGYSGLAATVLSALRVPWVLDVDDWEGPGGWVDVNPYSPAEKLAISIMDAVLPRMAGTVTAASRTLEARTWGFGLPRHRVFYLPNGVSAYRYGAWSAMSADRTTGARPQPLSAGRPSILLYTRFAEFPYQWPLEVLRLVLADHPTARLLVVGEGFFDEEHRLYSEATRTGIHRHIDIIGRVSEQDLPAYLSSADVCIYPMEDNLINRAKSPVKLLEVMLMGVPVVAHRVGEVGEFVGDEGVLVRPADLPGMAVAVSDLLRDPARRQVLGERARRRVWADFNWQGLCVVAEEAYRRAMSRGSREAG